MSKCHLCPRNCMANREAGQVGSCGVTGRIKVARAALHYWEEPCISGENGSGAIFFSGCNLHCLFCQNQAISDGVHGKEITKDRLMEIFFELRAKGANNINLVTPTHYIDSIADAISRAKKEGFDLPFVYNSSGYEKVSSLKKLDGLIDVYLPDFKYISSELARKFSKAADYPEVARKAIAEMFRQVGACVFEANRKISTKDNTQKNQMNELVEGEKEIIKKGVIVRHLILPAHTKDSMAVIKEIYDTYGDDVYLSLMNQYTPLRESSFNELNRRLTNREYNRVIDYALDIGVTNAFIQEGDVASESFIPEFNLEGV